MRAALLLLAGLQVWNVMDHTYRNAPNAAGAAG